MMHRNYGSLCSGAELGGAFSLRACAWLLHCSAFFGCTELLYEEA